MPGGHNRRRRLATGSRQPKRGFGTAVPKTMIEVADHCPLREPEGLSPDGGLHTPINRKSHQTREPWHLSCHGGNSAARPLCPEQPRAHRARCGVKGGERKRVPGGHNRRRRLATGSRQPKRGFGTAVPKTMIEVADHCPLREPEGLSPDGGLHTPINRKSHQTREPWHLSCHGGKTPAKPYVSLRPCAPTPLRAYGAQSGVQGVTPC